MLDYGGSWPEGSPRAIGDEMAHRLDEEESESMSRVATLVERSRYARSFDHGGAMSELPTMTSEIRRGVAAPADLRQRVVALLLPRSLFRRLKSLISSCADSRPLVAATIHKPSSRRRRQRSSILSMKPCPSWLRDPCEVFARSRPLPASALPPTCCQE